MVVRGHKHVHSDPYKCSICGAMVFVTPRLHDVLCNEYVSHPDMVPGTHRYFGEMKAQEASDLAMKLAEEAAKPKRERKKKVAKNTGIQTEEPTPGED
jgi:hypothetical protein